MIYVVPVVLCLIFAIGVARKVKLYDSFVAGVKEAVGLSIRLLPYLAVVFMAMELMRASGLSAMLGKLVSPLFSLLGIPKELAELLILRPLSGSGSLAVLESIFIEYGVDSYISRSASVIMGSSDTVLYIAAVYFSGYKENGTRAAVPIALAVTFLGAIAACLVCRFI